MIPISPFEAEYAAHDRDGKCWWSQCTVVGIREGSTRFEFIALIPYDEDMDDNHQMMCVMSLDDVRIRATDKPADAPSV